MKAVAFLRSGAVNALLDRAARAAGTPLSIHFLSRNQEGPVLGSWGRCEACRYVADTSGGNAACRLSRVTASAMALQQRLPISAMCHMGFGLLCVPALPDEDFVLTFGPFCPADEGESLEYDALRGLEQLGEEQGRTSFPVTLEDIHRAPRGALSAAAEWVVEDLNMLWEEMQRAEAENDADDERDAQITTSKRPARSGVPTPHPAAEITVALAGGNQPQARELLKASLEETATNKRVPIALRRARTIAAAAAVLEAGIRAGTSAAAAWAAFPAFLGSVQAAQDNRQLLDAAMQLLRLLKNRAAKPVEATANYEELNAILQDRLIDGITLGEVAQRLNETPSAISHRLKRKFGMSYSEYLGRLRVEKAKELLRRTKLSATDIARRVGIKDQSNFGKLFKRFEGMPPLEYRKRFGRHP